MSFFESRLAEPGAVLAPMAGYTDAPFRKLCRGYGSAWAVTEMVSTKALVLGQQRGIEIGEPYPGEPDLVIQIFGSEAEVSVEGARMLYERYRPAALDLNMGCPVKKIINKGCGAQLMREPERAAAIVAALTKALAVPISVKMRLGFDKVNVLECALAVAEAGAAAVAIHGRTAVQKYSGEADWTAIAEVAERVNVPVIGSGDVTSRAQFERYKSRGLGVMVARASLGRPWIFAELRGEPGPNRRDIIEIAYRHSAMNCAWYGEAVGMRSLRGQLARYFAWAPEWRKALMQVETLTELEGLLSRAFGYTARDGLDLDPWHRKAA